MSFQADSFQNSAFQVAATTSASLQIWNTSGSGYVDYSNWLYADSNPVVKVAHSVNQPRIATFVLTSGIAGLVLPDAGNRVKFTTATFGVAFTGYITSISKRNLQGFDGANPVWGYEVQATSEEIVLEWKASGIFPTLPPFLNQTQGQIIKQLITALGGTFDTAHVQSGVMVPFFRVKPEEGFWEAVRRLSDRMNMAFWVVNGAAYYQPYGQNLLQQSQQIGASPWSTGGVAPAVTQNSTADPNGIVDGSQIAFPITGAGQESFAQQDSGIVPVVNQAYTFSCWLKASSSVSVNVRLVQATGENDTLVACALTSSWKRFSVTITPGAVGTGNLLARIHVGASQPAITCFAWGAQLELNSIAGQYVATNTITFQGLPFGYNYDETDTQFDPGNFDASIVPAQVYNDVVGVGSIPEPQGYVREYFVGDGLTASFPLKLPMFGSVSSLLVEDDWTEAAFDLSKWIKNDVNNLLALNGGALQLNGGAGLSRSWLTAQQGIELAGKVEMRCGRVNFYQASSAILGGIYSANDGTLAHCLAGVLCTPNGSQTDLQAVVNGVASGPVYTTATGKTYLVSIFVDAPEDLRQYHYFFSRTASYGGGTVSSTPQVSFLVSELPDVATDLPSPVLQYTASLTGAPLWAYYTPASGPLVNTGTGVMFTLNFTVIKKPVQAELWTNMVQVYGHDEFQRASLGTNWTAAEGALAIFNSSEIYNPGASGVRATSFYNQVAPPADQYAELRISTTANPNVDTNGIGPAVRISPTADSYYAYLSSGDARHIVRSVAGVITTLATQTVGGGAKVTDVLRIEIRGNLINTFWNGAADLSYNDNTLTTGNVGVSSLSDGANAIRGNDWTGGGLVYSASASQPWTRYKIGDKTDPEARAAVVQGDNTTVLQFFQQQQPAAGEIVRVMYRAAGIIRSRVQDPALISSQASASGDSGVRSAVLPSLNIPARNSSEMEAAIQAFMDDHNNPYYEGTWMWSTLVYANAAVLPVPGRYMNVNSARFGPAFSVFVTGVEIDFLFVDTNSNQEIIETRTTFGPLYRLDEEQKQFEPPDEAVIGQYDSVLPLTILQRANIASTFSGDRPYAVYDGNKTGTTFEIDTGAVPDSSYEVRKTDEGWGLGASVNQISTPTIETFTVPRNSRDVVAYIKNKNASGALSRYPAVVRIVFPLIPRTPTATIDYSDAVNPVVNVDPEILTDPDAYGFVITDNAGNILYKISNLALLPTDLAWTYKGNASRALTFKLYAVNLLGEQTPTTTITATIPTPSVSGLAVDETTGTLKWTGTSATQYLVEIATDAAYTNIILSKTTTDQFFRLDDENTLRLRYFRITPQDALGSGTAATASHSHAPAGVTELTNTNEVFVVPQMPTPTTDVTVPSPITSWSSEFQEEARRIRTLNTGYERW